MDGLSFSIVVGSFAVVECSVSKIPMVVTSAVVGRLPLVRVAGANVVAVTLIVSFEVVQPSAPLSTAGTVIVTV